jgi:sec-independent protein translocase protein TatC
MDRQFTVTEHLEELRKRVIISLAAVILATLVCVPFSPQLLQLLKLPANGAIKKLAYFGPEEAFMIYMRVSFTAGLLISFPVLVAQFWAFVSPAVEERARRSALFFVAASSAAFAGGCAFSFLLMIPAALKFLLGIGAGDLEPVISASRYISFVTGLVLACGIVFEMPVLAYFLTRMGVLDPRILRKKFKYAAVCIAIAAAVITPTGDAFNMTVLALPMVALYEVSIWVSHIARKR